MREPYKIVRWPYFPWLRNLWWWIRGVTKPEDYRSLCRRCGKTGQVHWFSRCVRFNRRQR